MFIMEIRMPGKAIFILRWSNMSAVGLITCSSMSSAYRFQTEDSVTDMGSYIKFIWKSTLYKILIWMHI